MNGMIRKIDRLLLSILVLLLGALLLGCANPTMSDDFDGLAAVKADISLNFVVPDGDLGETSTVELLAGRDKQLAGRVTTDRFTEDSEEYLRITYATDPGWFITETHLQVAFDATRESFPDDFHLNQSYSPQIGQFDQTAEHDYATIAISEPVKIPPGSTHVHFAAHAVVSVRLFFATLEEYLADSSPVDARFSKAGIDRSKWSVELTFPDSKTELFPTWCIDPANSGCPATSRFSVRRC